MFRRKEPVRPPAAENVGTSKSVAFQRLPQWLYPVLGLQVEQTPSRLVLPDVQPVLEIHRPVTRVAAFVAAGTAGQNVTIPVPDTEEWELVSMFFNFDTSAAVANREVSVTLQTLFGGAMRIYYTARGNYTQVAGLSGVYSFAPAGVVGDTGTISDIIIIPAPIGCWIHAGSEVRLAATGIDVADQFSAITLVARVWNSAPPPVRG